MGGRAVGAEAVGLTRATETPQELILYGLGRLRPPPPITPDSRGLEDILSWCKLCATSCNASEPTSAITTFQV